MKKLFALLLAVVMLLSLAACDTEKPVDTKPQETQGNQPAETKGTEPPETQGPPVTVKWLTICNEPEGADAVVDHINELLLERYNLQVEFDWIGTGEYNERTKLASTGGEDYDIVYTTYVWLNKFEENLARGAFYDITDILVDGTLRLVDMADLADFVAKLDKLSADSETTIVLSVSADPDELPEAVKAAALQ